MTKNTQISQRVEDFTLLIENHTYLMDGEVFVFQLDTIGLVTKTNHLQNDNELINKVQTLVNMVNDDLSLLEKDIQTELWDMVN